MVWPQPQGCQFNLRSGNLDSGTWVRGGNSLVVGYLLITLWVAGSNHVDGGSLNASAMGFDWFFRDPLVKIGDLANSR